MTITGPRKIAFVFPTAGTQRVGMGRHLESFGKKPFEKADRILGTDLTTICYHGPAETLGLAQYTNAAIYAQSLITFELLKERGIKPDAVIGYSLGEYAALSAAGVFGFEQGLRFLFESSKVYQNNFPANEYGMALAIGMTAEELEAACHTVTNSGTAIFVSNYNGPMINLISGKKAAFPLVWEIVKGEYRKISPVDINVPSHSLLVRPLEEKLEHQIDLLFENAGHPQTAFVSTVTGQFVQTFPEINLILKRHLSSPVRWEDSINALLDDGINTFIEVGPTGGLPKILELACSFRGIEAEILTTATNHQKAIRQRLDPLEEDIKALERTLALATNNLNRFAGFAD